MGILSSFRKGIKALGEMIVGRGLATEEQVTDALAEQERRRRKGRPRDRIGEILVDREIVSEDQVHEILSKQESALLVNAYDKGGDIVYLDLEGYVDADTYRVLNKAFVSLINAGHTKFVVNGANLSYMNSDGVGAIVGHARGVRQSGGDIKFYDLHDKAAAVFESLGLTPLFVIVDTEEEAVAAFSEAVPEELYKLPDYRFFSSKRSKTYHALDCPVGRRIRPENRVSFVSTGEASDAGKNPCSKCCKDE